jgi:hypothetical protein
VIHIEFSQEVSLKMNKFGRFFGAKTGIAFTAAFSGLAIFALSFQNMTIGTPAFADPAAAPMAPVQGMAGDAKATKKEVKKGSAKAVKSSKKMAHHMKMAAKHKPSAYMMKVQKALIAKGAKIKADGFFGPASRKALMDYQKVHKLNVTGRVDAATKKSLGL